MSAYRYLVVGGGMAAHAAVRGIREIDPEGSLLLIGEEADPPYKRPPLTKGLWQGKPLDAIWSRTERLGVELRLGRTVVDLDPARREVTDDRGDRVGYERLLLATGSRPRRLPLTSERLVYLRSLQDYRTLRALAEPGIRVAVIGSGFIGTEIAAALALNRAAATMIFPEPLIGVRMFPSDLAQSVTDLYRAHDVEVLAGQTVVDLQDQGDRVELRVRDLATGDERTLAVDVVVAGVGAEPNVDLARRAGLTIEDGIVVDQFLRTSDPNVYAAGDVASIWQPALGVRRRVEHEDNAKTMGWTAGRAMAGQPTPYHRLPFFYSDLFELGYEAVGEIDARHEMEAVWEEPFRTGVVYYRRDGRVRGVLLWNVWGKVAEARRLIATYGATTLAEVSDEPPAPPTSLAAAGDLDAAHA